MSERKSGEQRRREAAARIWLSYYNRMLYERGIITEKERSRMELKIRSWKMSVT